MPKPKIYLKAAIKQYMQSCEPSAPLIVLKTGAGQGSALAVAIDDVEFPEILGTIARDNTVLLICRDREVVEPLAKQFNDWKRSV